mmetsp:Transcript_31638/g.50930  ORF Transcript_31638/g.50930 Transcript_31638/m.50930 type:complete len:202 (-) Transcript_31638:735-1340(-)
MQDQARSAQSIHTDWSTESSGLGSASKSLPLLLFLILQIQEGVADHQFRFLCCLQKFLPIGHLSRHNLRQHVFMDAGSPGATVGATVGRLLQWICLMETSLHQFPVLSFKHALVGHQHLTVQAIIGFHLIAQAGQEDLQVLGKMKLSGASRLVPDPALEAICLSSIDLCVGLFIIEGRQQRHATFEALHGHHDVEAFVHLA